MKKSVIGLVLCMALSVLQGVAQQVGTKDVSGDKEYARVCREYELKSDNSVELLKAYLKQYPDSRHANRVKSMIASAYVNEERYPEALEVFKVCDLEALPDKERDESVCKMATAYLKTGDLKEAKVWFTMLQEVSKTHSADATFNLGYMDYVEKHYDKALEAFASLQKDKTYATLVPYYMGEICLLRKDYREADKVATEFLQHYAGHKDEAEMLRIQGEARYGLQNYLDAITSLEAYVASAGSPQRKALYELGMSHYHAESYSKAVEALGKVAVTEDALSQNAYLHMGLAYLNLKERNQARMAFEQASLGDYDLTVKEQALYNYALCIHETSYSPFAESVHVFERFLNEFPNSVYAEKVDDYLVEVYMNTRSYEAALGSIEKIRQPGARILEAKQNILFRLGTQAFANAQFPEAINYLDESLKFGQYNASTKAGAYYWRGEANYRLEKYVEAGKDLKQYLKYATDRSADEYGLALYNLGYTEFKQKRYGDALNWFSQYVKRGGKNHPQVQADAYNRMGDCHFYVRDFDAARKSYAKAVETEPALGDYSIYQEAFVKGLQKDYTGKIQLLNKLITDYPKSQYIDDALYEQGRSFVQLEDNANAIGRYQMLVKNFPESYNARKAANEIGLLYYQDDKFDEAIAAYQAVIKNYPGSEEARLAQRDLKSIYIDLNRVDEYANYASTISGGVNFDVNERDSLTYVAAERVYMRGDTNQAKESFMRYLQTFPEGAFSLNANYFVGLIEYNQKNYEQAMACLNKVLEYPANKYSEDARVMSAEMAYVSKDYDKALEHYKRLREQTASSERRQLAETGMLRSAAMMGNTEEIIFASTAIITEAKVSPEVLNEALYYRAKALVAIGQQSEAMNDWKTLSADTRNVYGAEAKYQLAQAYYDAGKYAEAEAELLDYINVSTPHVYWLARGFVLLSDVYSKMGRKLDARQYLLSLKQNYQAEDDIAGMIESRLEALKE